MNITEVRDLLDQMQREPSKQSAATYSGYFHQIAKFIEQHKEDIDSARVVDLCMEIRGELKTIGERPSAFKAKRNDDYVRDKILRGVKNANNFLKEHY